jgi:hypothetical protein
VQPNAISTSPAPLVSCVQVAGQAMIWVGASGSSKYQPPLGPQLAADGERTRQRRAGDVVVGERGG